MFRTTHSTTATYYPKNPESGTALDGLDYRQARYYDSDLGLFLSVDPLGAKAPDWIPDRYGFNNPIRYIDPDGMATLPPGDHYVRNGVYLGNDGIDYNMVYQLKDNKRAKFKNTNHLEWNFR